jgi:hypothetical protein
VLETSDIEIRERNARCPFGLDPRACTS